jgi:transcriptional regulator with XRE-family HTH domain
VQPVSFLKEQNVNVGERIRQLRSERNLTQPQLAQAIGIEQSYLSKLENDKSVPSADIFQAVLKAFAIDVGSFLKGVDAKIVHGDLRQIPEVANLLNADNKRRVHGIKRWLFGSAALCVLGLTSAVAGYRGFLFPNTQYNYRSEGVVLAGEPSNIFDDFRMLVMAKVSAQELTHQEGEKRAAEYISRVNQESRVSNEYRGLAFVEPVEGGSRSYKFWGQAEVTRRENRYLLLLGTLLTFAGIFGFFVEFRLRKVG